MIVSWSQAVCDLCGQTADWLPPRRRAAVDAALARGWDRVKIGGALKDVCPACLDDRKEERQARRDGARARRENITEYNRLYMRRRRAAEKAKREG